MRTQRCFAVIVGLDEEDAPAARQRRAAAVSRAARAARSAHTAIVGRQLDMFAVFAAAAIVAEEALAELRTERLTQIRKGPRSLHPGKITRREREAWASIRADWDSDRPLTHGDCQHGPRPCPWVSCRHHLFLNVNQYGSIKLSFPGVGAEDLDQLADTCALDVADRVQGGSMPLEDVGRRLGMTLERARQIQEGALAKLRILVAARDALDDVDDTAGALAFVRGAIA